jgi:hypothetical protein
MRWIVAAILLIGMYGSGALACSCSGGPENDRAAVAKALTEAALVFVGRIESKEKYSVDEDGYKLEYERTQFYVVQSWKGEKASRVYVESMVTCCMCGYAFPETGSFLVYAYGPKANGYYSTSICHRTKPLEAATQEVGLLDEIVAAAQQTSDRARTKPKME